MSTSRIPVTAPRGAGTFGLFAFVESKRVILPLKGVECDFSVMSGMAEVAMTQIFRQDNKSPLDCEYLFPLPADASVYCCEADINGRTIRARVRERQEARQIAAEKKAAGFRTALVEAERENLFTLGLGNVQPGDLVIIKLKYIQTLRWLAGKCSVEIPFCPGVRYIPGMPLLRSNRGKGVIDDTNEVPDASRITPVRIDAEHPDAAYMEVRGTLDGKFVDDNTLVSPSHEVSVLRSGDELRVSLAGKGEVPDRDFVVRWSEKNAETVASRAWVHAQGEATYALLEIRAPQTAPSERAPADFYFLVDRSGSMEGEKWNKAADALQACVKVLGPADRVMVTLFDEGFRDFAERPLSAEELLSDRQFQALKKVGTGGGTELLPTLEHVIQLAAGQSRSRRKNLILITDAQVGNESAILESLKTAPEFPVHAFGIDVALNDSLLLALCRQQGGTFHSLNPNDDIEDAVTTLGKTLSQPVLLNLALPDGWETADAVVPNLYAGQIHYLSARATSGAPPLEIQARNATSQPVTIQFERQACAGEGPYLHWCRSRIQRLVAEGRDQPAVALSVHSNLICPLTAFIAWDEAEKVPVASHELVQPAPQMLLCRCFGLAERQSFLSSSDHLVRRFSDEKLGYVPVADLWLRGVVGKRAAADEVSLVRDLANICHRTGVSEWKRLSKAILDWIWAAKGAERTDRQRALQRVLEEVKVQAKRFDEFRAVHDELGMDEVRDKIQQLVKEFVDKLAVGK